MADKKISQLTALSAANLAPSTDVLAIVDTSATETKKIVAQDLINGVLNVASAVGIGTTSPGAKLQVVGTGQFGGTGTDGAIQFLRSSDGGAVASMAFISASTEVKLNNALSGPMTFFTNNTERMRLDSSGNLGIGTSSPEERLHVIGASNTSTTVQISSANSGYAPILNFDGVVGAAADNLLGVVNASWDTHTNVVSSIRFESGADTTNKDDGLISFWTSASGPTLQERARITSGGEFLVAKTAASVGNVGFEALPSGFIASSMAASTNAADTLNVYSTGASAYRFYVQLDGKVNATNTTIAAISDQRLKENIRDLDVGLDAVMALKPRKFDWKAGKGKDIKDDRGWIAQEFEQVFPDLIDTWKDPAPEGEEPYKSVRADLIPVLVKAIQEQQAMIETLKAKVAALEAK